MNDIDLTAQEITAPSERSVPSTEIELWETLRVEARRIASREGMLREFLDLAVLRHASLGQALASLLARKLAEPIMPEAQLEALVHEALTGDPTIIAAAAADLIATRTRDPAAETYVTPFLLRNANLSMS